MYIHYIYPLYIHYSLPRLCLEGSYSLGLKGQGTVTRPGRFPRSPPRGSPSCAPWGCAPLGFLVPPGFPQLSLALFCVA